MDNREGIDCEQEAWAVWKGAKGEKIETTEIE